MFSPPLSLLSSPAPSWKKSMFNEQCVKDTKIHLKASPLVKHDGKIIIEAMLQSSLYLFTDSGR